MRSGVFVSLFLMLAGAAAAQADPRSEPPDETRLLNTPLPDILLTTADGDRISLSALSRTPLVLGEAFVDTRQRTGVLATVFADRVELLAGLSETDSALLLGRAIAHEVGHLLLGSNAHSLRGLMCAQWTPADIRRHARTDWELTRDDAAAIRKRLQ